MSTNVFVELELNEAIQLQSILNMMAMKIREDDRGKEKQSELPETLMKISLKVTTGLLQSFMEAGNGY